MRSSTVPDHSLSIIVPTLNEEENVEPLVSQITARAVPFREILFVDDHSTDGTRDRIRALAERYPIRLNFRFDGCARCSAISRMDDLVLV